MESHGLPDAIQVTRATYERLRDNFELRRRGPIEVKGKGEMVTYMLIGRKNGGAGTAASA
jgi:class 3 adenylate cyclase